MSNFLTCAPRIGVALDFRVLRAALIGGSRDSAPGDRRWLGSNQPERSKAGLSASHRSFLHAGTTPVAPLKSADQAYGKVARLDRPVKPRLLAPFHREHPTTGAGRGG